MKRFLIFGLIVLSVFVSCRKQASVTVIPFGRLSTGEKYHSVTQYRFYVK